MAEAPKAAEKFVSNCSRQNVFALIDEVELRNLLRSQLRTRVAMAARGRERRARIRRALSSFLITGVGIGVVYAYLALCLGGE